MVVTLFNFSVGVDDATWWDLGDESADFTEFAAGHLQTADNSHAQTVVWIQSNQKQIDQKNPKPWIFKLKFLNIVIELKLPVLALDLASQVRRMRLMGRR